MNPIFENLTLPLSTDPIQNIEWNIYCLISIWIVLTAGSRYMNHKILKIVLKRRILSAATQKNNIVMKYLKKAAGALIILVAIDIFLYTLVRTQLFVLTLQFLLLVAVLLEIFCMVFLIQSMRKKKKATFQKQTLTSDDRRIVQLAFYSGYLNVLIIGVPTFLLSILLFNLCSYF